MILEETQREGGHSTDSSGSGYVPAPGCSQTTNSTKLATSDGMKHSAVRWPYQVLL